MPIIQRLSTAVLLAVTLCTVQASTSAAGKRAGKGQEDRARAERGRAMLGMARSMMTAQPAVALEKVTAALELAEQAGDAHLTLDAVRFTRDLERQSGVNDRFLASAIRAVNLSAKHHDARAHAGDLSMLAEAYERTEAHDLAVENARQGLLLARTAGDDLVTGRCINTLLEALVHSGRYDEVLVEGHEGLRFHEKQGNLAGQAAMWLAQGEALNCQGRFGDALPYLAKAERIHRERHSDPGLYRTLCVTTRAYIGLKRWSNAGLAIHEAGILQERLPADAADPELMRLESMVLENQGLFEQALAQERLHGDMQDSMHERRMADRTAGMRAIFMNDQRAAELKELRRSNVAQMDLLRTERMRTFLALGAAGLLLLMLAAMVRLWFRNRRTIRRASMRAQVIHRQGEEIRAKNLELERQNLRLAESLIQEEEKDVLLKEIHHRVKNNLQIVITLLRMQGAHIKDERLEEVLSDCEGRVRSMALVHEHIYRCGDLRRVNVRDHLMALGEGVLKHYGLEDKVSLDLLVNYDLARFDDLIPLSLIINELLTNAARNAFFGEEGGRIAIVVRNMGGNQYELTFSNDGATSAQEDLYRNGSFGLELLRVLAAQLNGRIRLLRGEATTFQMTFEPEERELRRAS